MKQRVLTEANLTSLVALVNQELSQAARETHTRREEVEAHIEDLRARLHKLYGALETGQLSVEDLAPRIKELRGHIEGLEARHSSFDSIREAPLRLTREEVLSAVQVGSPRFSHLQSSRCQVHAATVSRQLT